MRPPIIQPPIYLAGAPPPAQTVETVKIVAAKASPFAGLIGATALGATAAYFAPKFFDWALARLRGDEVIDLEIDGDGEG